MVLFYAVPLRPLASLIIQYSEMKAIFREKKHFPDFWRISLLRSAEFSESTVPQLYLRPGTQSWEVISAARSWRVPETLDRILLK